MRLLFLVFFLLASPLLGEEDAPRRTPPFRHVAVITLEEASDEAIDPSVKVSVLRRLAKARELGADCVVFHIQSYGGRVDAALETADEIFELGRAVHTIAYVPRRALSAGTMIAIACREIVMSEAGVIGDAEVILGVTGETAPEKAQSVVAATFRKYAERNGYPPLLAQAMVRKEMEVVRYRKPNDPRDPASGFVWVYYPSGDEPSESERRAYGLHGRETVVREGQLLTAHAREAVDLGFASRIAPTLDDLLAELKGAEGTVTRLEWTAAERISRWLLGIRALLFLLGAGALYLALKMPGTGVPEALTLLFFGLFFGASAIAGFSGVLEVALFVAGVALLAVEIFVLPGFGVTGLAGLACVLLSIGLAAIPQDGGSLPASAYLLPMARDFLLATLGAIVLVMLLARYLPAAPLFRRLMLAGSPAPGSQTGSAVGAAAAAPHPLEGREGLAETALRPAGKAVIDGRRLDVVSESGFVEPGERVRVITVRGGAVVVRRVGP